MILRNQVDTIISRKSELLLQSKSFKFFDSVSFEQKAPLPGDWLARLSYATLFQEPFSRRCHWKKSKFI